MICLGAYKLKHLIISMLQFVRRQPIGQAGNASERQTECGGQLTQAEAWSSYEIYRKAQLNR